MPKARFIVPDDFTREEFRSVARAQSWAPANVYDTPGGTYEEIWANADQMAALHYVEDREFSQERFLVLRSNDLPSYQPAVERAFRTISIEEICRTILYSSEIAERTRAVTQLGVVAFKLTTEVRTAWETGLFHPDERLRLATVRAMSFIGSPALLPLLEETAQGDISDEVMHEAQRLIDAIHRHSAERLA